MFKATMNSAKEFYNLFALVEALIDEAQIILDPEEGLSIVTMDKAHICLIALKIAKDDFELFECSEHYELGVSMTDFIKVLKRHTAKDSLIISHNPKENKILVEFKRENSKKTRKFKQPLVDLEGEEINLESLGGMEFINSATVYFEDLKEALADAEIIGEVQQITVKETILFFAEGQAGEMEFELYPDEMVAHEFTGVSKGIFANSFLKNIYKASTLTKDVKLSFESEKPLKVEISLLEQSSLVFYLAMRVETDDDAMMED